jgi:hypothetical protein
MRMNLFFATNETPISETKEPIKSHQAKDKYHAALMEVHHISRGSFS